MSDIIKKLRKTAQSGKPTHVSKADRLAVADRIEELEANLPAEYHRADLAYDLVRAALEKIDDLER